MITRQNNTNSLYSLSIQIHLDGLSFFTQHIHSKDVKDAEVVRFRENVNPTTLLLEIEKAFKEVEALAQPFSKVTVVYANELFTLVPKALFDSEKAADYLKFNTKILSTDYIAHDTIDFYDLINVYVPYSNVNNFFFDTFGSFEYYHSTTIFAKHLLIEYSNNEEAQVLVNLQRSYFEMGVVKNKKLLFINRFEIRAKEDFIYYLLFTLEQLELNPESTSVTLTGTIEKDDEFYNIAHTYIRHLIIKDSPSTATTRSQSLLATLL
ncbi:DUF3822 family protein [Dokdonia sp. PRO95]|uniref:DUF3822 family protein n=1 Tax=Dokdonia sp. PRO95 TaxID=1239415 RepID=UPI001CEFAC43|nr:DUF3822 family protein [Dokdonia sp. PRO95]